MSKQKKGSFFRDVIVVGFALFSMFFGAGNVIFPPYLGMESGQQWLAGFSAYYIADIGLALLGMFALLRQSPSSSPSRKRQSSRQKWSAPPSSASRFSRPGTG